MAARSDREGKMETRFLPLLGIVASVALPGASQQPETGARPATVVTSAAARIPAPILHAEGHEHYFTPHGRFVRYQFAVLNHSAYPAEFFAAAPQLPPCGSNANSARSWVDFHAEGGARLYGFCALTSPQQLDAIWFAVPEGAGTPRRVYIEMTDRQTNTLYRSNLETITPCLVSHPSHPTPSQ